MKPSIALLLSSLALGQELRTDSPGMNLAGGVTPKEAVETALRRNPGIGVVRGAVAVAEGRLAEAGIPNSPGIKLGVTDMGNVFDINSSRRMNVGLSWSPPRLGELGLRRAMARSQVKQTEGELRIVRTQLAAEVLVLHRTIRLLDERIRLAESVEGLRSEIFRLTAEQVQAGVKTAVELGVVELAAAEGRSVTVQLRLERQLEMNRLLAKLNLPASTSLMLRAGDEEARSERVSLDRARLTASALASRAEIEVAQARCSQAESDLRMKSAERYPWFSSVDVGRRTARLNDPGFWVAQANIELPIFRWRDSYLRSTKAAVERCGAARDVAQAAIVAEIEELVSLLETRYRELDNYRESLVPIAERHAAQVKEALAAGRADVVEALAADVRRMGLRQEMLAKTIEVGRLELGLQQAAGGTLD